MAKSVDIKPVLEFGGKMPEGLPIGEVKDLEENCEGKIILVKGLVLREMVEKAKALGAKGVVADRINYRDYQALLKGGDEFPVAIIEGFGVKSIDA